MIIHIFFCSNVCMNDHNYQLNIPNLKRKYDDIQAKFKNAKEKLAAQNNEIKKARNEIMALKEKMKSILEKTEINQIQKQKLNALCTNEFLQNLVDQNSKSTKTFDDEVRKFSLSLHFYSPKEWNFDLLNQV